MPITAANIDNKVQLRLRNMVNSPLSQSTRYDAYNDVIDILQSEAHWNFTIKRAFFQYLSGEAEYSLENNLGVTDFKGYKDLKFVNDSQNRHYQEFEEIDSNSFSVDEGRVTLNNYINFEEREGDIIMRVLSNYLSGKTLVDGMDNLTTGRTWVSDTTTSDATTLVLDTTRGKIGNSLRFNIDVDQSANNRATIYTSVEFSSPIDASNLENFGHFRLWRGLQSMSAANLARISSVTFVWGSDGTGTTPATKANYWERTVTAPAQGGDWFATWNRENFDWDDATSTGSPDSSDLKYFEVTINYTAAMTDTRNVRIDGIDLFDPSEMELIYYSTNFVNNGGTWQRHFSTDTIDPTEQLLLPERHVNLFVNLALKELYPQKEKNNEDYIRVDALARQQLALAIQKDGNAITREKNEFEVAGQSNGRRDGFYNQW